MLMLNKLREIESRYEKLNVQLSTFEIIADTQLYQKTAKAHSELAAIVDKFRQWKDLEKSLAETKGMLQEEDAEMRALAEEEWATLEQKRDQVEGELKLLLVPKDPHDEKNVVLEIRAGTGGDEATLFAQEMFRMYCRYAESQRWRVEMLSSSYSGIGGLKEVIAMIEGSQVYSKMKYESGVHRVQRVPQTEQQGRVHTSAVTVAVLPEANEVEVAIDPKEIRIDTFCSSGPGGQSVNTTYSAVRITHQPTGSGGLLPGREVADQKQGQGDAGAAQPPARPGAGKAARRAGPGAQGHGGQRRPQRKDSNLQLPSEPPHRPPHRADALSARLGDGRPPGAGGRTPCHASPSREAQAGAGDGVNGHEKALRFF